MEPRRRTARTKDDPALAGNPGTSRSHDQAIRDHCTRRRTSPLRGYHRTLARVRATLPVLIAIRNQVGVGGDSPGGL